MQQQLLALRSGLQMCLVQQSRDANSVILVYFSRQAIIELPN